MFDEAIEVGYYYAEYNPMEGIQRIVARLREQKQYHEETRDTLIWDQAKTASDGQSSCEATLRPHNVDLPAPGGESKGEFSISPFL